MGNFLNDLVDQTLVEEGNVAVVEDFDHVTQRVVDEQRELGVLLDG